MSALPPNSDQGAGKTLTFPELIELGAAGRGSGHAEAAG